MRYTIGGSTYACSEVDSSGKNRSQAHSGSRWYLVHGETTVSVSYADTNYMTVELQASIEAPILGRALNRKAHSLRSCDGDQKVRRGSGSSTGGSSAVEFALVAPMFFLLFFAIFDFARLFYTEMTLQNAVREAGRYAVTGNHLPNPQHSGQNLSRVNSIIQVAQQAAMGLNISGIQVSSAGGGSGNAGGPGDTVTISLTTNVQLMTPIVAQFFQHGIYSFTVSVSFKNEPFPPGNTS